MKRKNKIKCDLLINICSLFFLNISPITVKGCKEIEGHKLTGVQRRTVLSRELENSEQKFDDGKC